MNRPFPSWLKPLLNSEANYEAIDTNMIFYSHENESQFHNKGKNKLPQLCGHGYINVDVYVTTTLRCSQKSFRNIH